MTLFVATLTDEASVHLRGPQIARFLQGQLTCDLRLLAPDRAIAGAMCTVKGRVISDLWVLRVDEDHCILRLRRSLADDFAANLERYARFSQIAVELDQRADAITGIYGELSGDDKALPAATGDILQRSSRLWLRSGPQQLQCIDTETDAGAGALDIPETAAAGEQAHWQAETLRDGHYALEKVDSERFTPQALNYDESGRVAFDKGCYTGQEVVARLHYRGQSKKRLVVLGDSSGDAAAAGDKLFNDDGRPVGECLRSEMDRDGRRLLAAQVEVKFRDGPLRFTDGRAASPLSRR